MDPNPKAFGTYKLSFQFKLVVCLLIFSFFHSDHHYQDVLKDKAKVPMEMSEDYPHYIRKRRDDNSNQPIKEVNVSKVFMTTDINDK